MMHVPLESDKYQLRSDAKRLFHAEAEADGESDIDANWETNYDTKYRSRHQRERHSERDGTAFASVALPAHYSAIVSVLSHVRQRLETEWTVRKVLDWGVGTGSGLW